MTEGGNKFKKCRGLLLSCCWLTQYTNISFQLGQVRKIYIGHQVKIYIPVGWKSRITFLMSEIKSNAKDRDIWSFSVWKSMKARHIYNLVLEKNIGQVPGRLTTFWQGHIICIYVIFCQLYLSKQLEFKVRYSIMLVMKASTLSEWTFYSRNLTRPKTDWVIFSGKEKVVFWNSQGK